MDPSKAVFGMADITVGEGSDALNFDGKTLIQAEGGELTLTPELEDIVAADFGNTPVDQRIVGYTGELTIVAFEESLKILEAAMSYTDSVENESGEKVGITDAKIGSSMREKAKPIRIHPRGREDEEVDITIYKMASTGDWSRAFGNEQGNITLTFSMYPRDGMDANKKGNFFYVGPVDPNATP
ncbi:MULTISPECIES: hypothetical protein [Bacillaceae]|uniref:hypothetical protein n=1 Tax=Shouchella oshimensis TaxID=290588 RepID=UPI0006EC060A|nr:MULTISPECIES: hypothetical protein [Bacillaceae]